MTQTAYWVGEFVTKILHHGGISLPKKNEGLKETRKPRVWAETTVIAQYLA